MVKSGQKPNTICEWLVTQVAGSPMVITLGQQYNVGEKPTVILYTYINRHAGTPTKGKTKQPLSLAADSGYVFFFIILYIKTPPSRS